MQKVLRRLSAAIVIVMALSTVLSAVAAQPDFVIGNNSFHETGVYGKDHYFGPWYEDGCVAYQSGTLVFDTSVANAWVTLNLSNDTLNAADYKYMLVKLKTDNPAAAKGFTMTIGKKPKGSRNVNNGMDYTAWTLANGAHPAALTTSYTTIAVDLAKSGTTTFNGDPDFAMNKGTAGNAKIYLSELVLTNTLPAGISAGVPAAGGKTTSTAPDAQSASKSVQPAQSTPGTAVSSEATSSTAVSSEEVSSDVSEASSEEAVSSSRSSAASAAAVSTAKHAPNVAVILIIIVAVLAAGTIAAIVILDRRKKNI